MVDVTATGDRIEERSDLGTGDAALYDYWMGQEKIAEREERKWIRDARKIVKRYRDERGDAQTSGTSAHRYNILWSNVQVLKPTLYGQTPKPDVSRRFLDQDDEGRLASIILERCISQSLDKMDSVMAAVVEDKLLPGRGVARVLYVPTFGDIIEPLNESNTDLDDDDAAVATVANDGDEGAQQEPEEPVRKVEWEEADIKYIFWEDYREGPARQWSEVPWVRYQEYLTRDELIKRFGSAKAKQVNLDYTPKGVTDIGKDDAPADLFKKAIVREYWDKSKKQVVWIAPGTPGLILDTADDPLGLYNFFPNPDPLLATTTNDKRIPVPDYLEYLDQARDMDTLTARIDRLTRALKVSGVYAAEHKAELQQLVDEGTENRLIPVHDFTRLSEKGGLAGIIEWLPIKQIAETLIQLYEARDKVKESIYEITGVADILRGETVPDETLGAQKLKSRFATRRIEPQQKAVARFARDLIRLIAEIVCEHFSPQVISAMSGYPQLLPMPQPPQSQPQSATPVPGQLSPEIVQYQQQAAQVQADNTKRIAAFERAVALLKKGSYGFRLDIEADSTIAPDEEAEKASRVEFLSEVVPLLQTLMGAAQGNPSMAKAAKEMALFGVRGFRVGRTLEETLEQAFDALGQMPPKPSAEDVKLAQFKADVQDTNARAQAETANTNIKAMTAVSDAREQAEERKANTAIQAGKLALEAANLESEQHFRNTRLLYTEDRMAGGLK